MTFLEWLSLTIFYLSLFFLYRSHREYFFLQLKETVTKTVTTALGSTALLQVIALLKFFKSRVPTVKKEGKTLHISYVERGKRYDLYLPYNKAERTSKTYEIKKDSQTIRFTAPPGIGLMCAAADFDADELLEVS